jgi:hypothetical protein
MGTRAHRQCERTPTPVGLEDARSAPHIGTVERPAACECGTLSLVDEECEHERWTLVEGEHWFVRARLRLLTSQEGGRATPIASGYRSHWTFPPEVHDEGHDAPLTLEQGPGVWLQPGEDATVRLHPLAPDLWPPLSPGLQLTMQEGARVVGVAEIIEVVAPLG